MKESILSRLESALKNGSVVLQNMTSVLNGEGYSQMEILDAHYQLFDKLRADGRETEEDTVSDAIDRITGWCSPHLKHDFSRPYAQEDYEAYMRQRSEKHRSKISL